MTHKSLTLTLLIFLAGPAASDATDREQRTAREWLETHLIDCEMSSSNSTLVAAAPGPAPPGLDVYANHDPVIAVTRGSRPMKIGDRAFDRGLYCHAPSKISVRLPGPGKRFSALAGLDHNEDTARGRGSVVFSVTAGDRQVFQSEVMRFGSPACEVDADLEGRQTFTLGIGDAGDGIGWDQSNWAKAKVTLFDGTELWLDELPLRDHRPEAMRALIPRQNALPFSFVYGGQSSDTLLAAWKKNHLIEQLDATRTRHTLVWTDGTTGLQVRCVSVEYADFPTLEWTVYFKNTGARPTPILENVQGLDASLEREADGEFVLNAWKGDTCAPDLYQPWTETLGPDVVRRFAPPDGRGTNGAFPYYNLRMPGGGILLAVGWPGQWAASFHPRCGSRDTCTCRSGTDPPDASARRGNPHAPDRDGILAWGGYGSGAEPLASLDVGPQRPAHAPTAICRRRSCSAIPRGSSTK